MKNRKKMAGTIAMIMALSLGYNAGGPVVVHAHENAVITEKLGETAASQEGVIDFSAIKDNEDLEVADYLPSDINDMEKICTEDYSVNLVDMADNTEDNKTVNDNPNDAKAISLGTQVYDTVATELEQRWYAFSVAKATKFTAAMVMDDTADFDLYVYKLNETDGTLELVGGSAIVGAGTQELSMLKLDEGIYFIGIEAATGNGSFLMYTYAGVNDGKEINDTTDLASSYVRNSRMTATIDSPFDYDYYKVVISKNDILEYTFDQPTGCDYKVLVYDGKNYYGGMAEGLVDITDLADFCADGTQEKVDEARAEILSGKCNVFDGKIETNTGDTIGKKGKTLDDGTITGGINWYYKNVKIVEQERYGWKRQIKDR